MTKEPLSRIYLASAAGKAITLVNRVVLVPLVAAALLPEEYATYTLLLSAVAFLSGMDIGIGGGTLTQIARAYARGDYVAIRRTARKAFVLTAGLCVLFLLTGLGAHYTLGWLPVWRLVISSINANPGLALLEFSAAIMVQCLFNMAMKVLQGIARQTWSNLLGGVVNLALALAILIFLACPGSKITALAQLTLILAALAQIAGVILAVREVAVLAHRSGQPTASEAPLGQRLAINAVPFGLIALATFVEREGVKWVLGSAGDLVAVGRLGIYSQLMVGGIGLVQMLVIPFWPLLLNQSADLPQQAALLRKAMRLSAAIAVCMLAAGGLAAGIGWSVSNRIWGGAYGWTQLEWGTFGLYVICSIPKHVFFPLLAGIGRIWLVAGSYCIEMILIIVFLGNFYYGLKLHTLFLGLAAISLLVSGPSFSVGVIRYLKTNPPLK